MSQARRKQLQMGGAHITDWGAHIIFFIFLFFFYFFFFFGGGGACLCKLLGGYIIQTSISLYKRVKK